MHEPHSSGCENDSKPCLATHHTLLAAALRVQPSCRRVSGHHPSRARPRSCDTSAPRCCRMIGTVPTPRHAARGRTPETLSPSLFLLPHCGPAERHDSCGSKEALRPQAMQIEEAHMFRTNIGSGELPAMRRTVIAVMMLAMIAGSGIA